MLSHRNPKGSLSNVRVTNPIRSTRAGFLGRIARNKPIWVASVLLVGGLTLAGCASTATETSSGTTASSSSSTTDSAIITASRGSADATTTAGTIADTTAAVEAFLATLSDEQAAAVVYDYETKTTSWSNFPVTFVERAGLNLADLTGPRPAT